MQDLLMVYIIITFIVGYFTVSFVVDTDTKVSGTEMWSVIVFWPLYIIKYTIKALWFVITDW